MGKYISMHPRPNPACLGKLGRSTYIEFIMDLQGAAHSYPKPGEVLVDANNLTTQEKALNGKYE